MTSRTRDKTDEIKLQDTDVEELISRVCAEFYSKIEKSFDSKFSKMEKQLASIETALSNTSKCAFQNKIEIAHLTKEISDLEQHQSINCIRIQGLREEADNEYLLENTLQFFEHSLNISCTKQEIDSIFRINGRQDVAKPRPIIVKFITNIKKNEIIGARKLLKNKNISVFEDLSKKKFQLLKMAKEKVGPKMAWSLGGKIFVWNEKHNKKIIINNEQDILDIDA
ncbi:hypothetical protein JTB14_016548 [Gonioctena quinquepunctata]|nr:hypothetical protein JTB14_016548 [Gonioctena quinquepunctata]